MERTRPAPEDRILADIRRMQLLVAPAGRPRAEERVVVELGPAQARRILRAIRAAKATAPEGEGDALAA